MFKRTNRKTKKNINVISNIETATAVDILFGSDVAETTTSLDSEVTTPTTTPTTSTTASDINTATHIVKISVNKLNEYVGTVENFSATVYADSLLANIIDSNPQIDVDSETQIVAITAICDKDIDPTVVLNINPKVKGTVLSFKPNSDSGEDGSTINPSEEPTTLVDDDPSENPTETLEWSLGKLCTRKTLVDKLIETWSDKFKNSPDFNITKWVFLAEYIKEVSTNYESIKNNNEWVIDEPNLVLTWKTFIDWIVENRFEFTDKYNNELNTSTFAGSLGLAPRVLRDGDYVYADVTDFTHNEDKMTDDEGNIIDSNTTDFQKWFFKQYGFKYKVSFNSSFGNNDSTNNSDILNVLSKDLPIINLGNMATANMFNHYINIYGVNTDYYKIDAGLKSTTGTYTYTDTEGVEHQNSALFVDENGVNTPLIINDEYKENFDILYNTLYYDKCFIVKKLSTNTSLAVDYGGFDVLWNNWPGDKTDSVGINEDIYNFKFTQNDIIQNELNPYTNSSIYSEWSETDKNSASNPYSNAIYNDYIINTKNPFVLFPNNIKSFLMYFTPELVKNPQIVVSNTDGSFYQGFGHVYNSDCYVVNLNGNYVYMISTTDDDEGIVLEPADPNTNKEGDYYYITNTEKDLLTAKYGSDIVFYSIADSSVLDGFDGYLIDASKNSGYVYAWDSNMPKYKMFYAKYLHPYGTNINDDGTLNTPVEKWPFLPNFTSDIGVTNSSYGFDKDYDLYTKEPLQFLKTNAESSVTINQYMNFSRGYFFIEGNIAQIEQKSILQFNKKSKDYWIGETEEVYLFIKCSRKNDDGNGLYINNDVNNVVLLFENGTEYYLQGDIHEHDDITIDDDTKYNVYGLYYKCEVNTENVDDKTGVPKLNDIWINGYNFAVYTSDSGTTLEVKLIDYIKIVKIGDCYGYLFDDSNINGEGKTYNKSFNQVLGHGSPYAYVQTVAEADSAGHADLRYIEFKDGFKNQSTSVDVGKIKDAASTFVGKLYDYTQSEALSEALSDGEKIDCAKEIYAVVNKAEDKTESALRKNIAKYIFRDEDGLNDIFEYDAYLCLMNQMEGDDAGINFDDQTGWGDFYNVIKTEYSNSTTNNNIVAQYHFINIGYVENRGIGCFKNFTSNNTDNIYNSMIEQKISTTSEQNTNVPGCWSCHFSLSVNSESNNKNTFVKSQNDLVYSTESYTQEVYTLCIIDGIKWNGTVYGTMDTSTGEESTTVSD